MRSVLLLLVGASCLAACGDDGNTNPGDPDARSGTGSDGGTGVDAPAFDAAPPSPDATPDANVPLPVSVTVASVMGPVEGVAVVYHDAAGQILAERVTDANGVATADVLPGGAVTAAVFSSSLGDRYELYTVLDLRPPQAFDVVIPYFAEVINPTVGYTVDTLVPSAQVASVATGYVIDNACATQQLGTPVSNPVSVPVRLLCDGVDPGPRDVLVWAIDDAGDNAGYAFAIEQPVEANQGDNPVVLDTWHTTVLTHALELSSAPVDLVLDYASFTQRRGAEQYESISDGVSQVEIGAGGGTSAVWAAAPEFATSYRHGIDFVFGTVANPAGGRASIALSDTSTPATTPLDLGAILLPRVHSPAASVDTDDRAQVSWSTDGPVIADALRASINWPGAMAQHYWHVLAPATASAPLVLPDLPATMNAYRPTQSDSLSVTELTLWEVDVLSDYGAFQTWYGTRTYADVEALGADFVVSTSRAD